MGDFFVLSLHNWFPPWLKKGDTVTVLVLPGHWPLMWHFTVLSSHNSTVSWFITPNICFVSNSTVAVCKEIFQFPSMLTKKMSSWPPSYSEPTVPASHKITFWWFISLFHISKLIFIIISSFCSLLVLQPSRKWNLS